MSSVDSVGSLLADIANRITDALRILTISDKRHWGDDEYEHARALERVLDEAKKDFQELGPLVNGQSNYQHDRKYQSLVELRELRQDFGRHVENLRDWSKSGGPIDPSWTRYIQELQRDLHRTQCKAARRIYDSGQEHSSRCLGAHLVYRTQRTWMRGRSESDSTQRDEAEASRQYLAEIVACNRVGKFRRFGEHDVAFVCDFCDGHIVWKDLDRMPSSRAEPATNVGPSMPRWQATGQTRTASEEKQIVYAPVAVANHCAPPPGDWIAGLMCQFCDDAAREPQDEDDDELWQANNDYEDIEALEEHLAWQHSPAQGGSKVASSCTMM